jgi:acyl-lipid omega-6 desaturase (Delta-12 desaturase)
MNEIAMPIDQGRTEHGSIEARIGTEFMPPVLSREQASSLRPSNFLGALHTVIACVLTILALGLARNESLGLWFVGQVLFAFAFIKWFTLLHEAGHQTLFASRLGNGLIGRIAAFFAILPYSSWKAIHRLHHKWTGWQDIDPTTTSLVPRTLGIFERAVIRIAWACWLPLFSVLYRLQSFWHLQRLFKLFNDSQLRRSFIVDMVGLIAVYGLTLVFMGPLEVLRLVGVGYFLGFACMDVIMLSQHTHIPLELSHGAEVKPIPAPEQAPYTRSLLFAPWLSKVILSGFDAHELHHVYPFVPGPNLRKIAWTPPNEVSGFGWTLAAKAVRADVFLFENRNSSGLSI